MIQNHCIHIQLTGHISDFPKNGVKSNRWTILIASMIINMCIGSAYAWSVFQNPLISMFGWSTSDTSLAFTLSLSLVPVAIIAGVATSLGHCYPLFAKFKGGKAVSTAAGYLLALSFLSETNGWIIGVIPIIVFFGLLKLFKMVSLASISAVTVATILLFTLQSNFMISGSFAIVAAIVIARHHENIGRIMAGTERKIKWMG